MRAEFIDSQKKAYPIHILSKVMKMSTSTYYKCMKSQRTQGNKLNKLNLILHVKSISKETRESYGSRRMSKELQNRGFSIGRYAARTLMNEAQVAARQRRKKKGSKMTPQRLIDVKNVLNRNFEMTAPNKAWVADITEIKSVEGKFYLASILDLYSRKIVGYALAERQQESLVSKALRMALGSRCPPVGCIYHSDRGSQYTSKEHMALATRAGFTRSLSNPGQCLDNSVKERFFGTLKREQVNFKTYATREEGMKDVREYIELFYNKNRLHSRLGYQSPMAFEERKYA